MSCTMTCENCNKKLDQVQYGSMVCAFCESVFVADGEKLESMWQEKTNLIARLVMQYFHAVREEQDNLDKLIKSAQEEQGIIQKEITGRHK